MNTDDYILQCATHLSNTNTYRQADQYPEQDISTQIENIITNFKPQIHGYNEQLYKYLLPNPKHTRIPQFYGIPKIHKTFTSLPPIRPIVSQTESPLSHTAQLIDHVLQPLAQTYPDYLHNSTSLVTKLQDLHLPKDCVLVTIDVESLYPSIPQTECLTIPYTEMHRHRQLILFDPIIDQEEELIFTSQLILTWSRRHIFTQGITQHTALVMANNKLHHQGRADMHLNINSSHALCH